MEDNNRIKHMEEWKKAETTNKMTSSDYFTSFYTANYSYPQAIFEAFIIYFTSLKDAWTLFMKVLDRLKTKDRDGDNTVMRNVYVTQPTL